MLQAIWGCEAQFSAAMQKLEEGRKESRRDEVMRDVEELMVVGAE